MIEQLREVQRFKDARARKAIAMAQGARKRRRGGVGICLPPRCEQGDCIEFAAAMYADRDNHGICLCSMHEPTPSTNNAA